jgi:superfamily II DNA or RNA helicase
MPITLSEPFFAKIAGWEAMKQARALLAGDKVLSSNWSPPVLKGVVQEGTTSYRAGLVIKDDVNIDNLCTCRTSREWGTICAHSVAIGLHHLRGETTPVPGPAKSRAAVPPAPQPVSFLQRSATEGEPAELFLILPPALDQSLARGKIMVVFEAKWRRGRTPLNALPKDETFQFPAQDMAVLDSVEPLAAGQVPAMLMLSPEDFASILPALVGHERVTLGKNAAVIISNEPWSPKLRAALQPNGEIVLSTDPAGPLPSPSGRGHGEGQTLPVLIADTWVWAQPQFRRVGIPKQHIAVLRGPVRIPRAHVPIFVSRDWPALEANGNATASFNASDFVVESEAPEIILELRGGLAQLEALLQFRYGKRILTAGAGAAEPWMPDLDSVRRYVTRDLAVERAALARLQRAGFTGPDNQARLRLLGNDRVLSFFAREFARLQREWQITMEERLQRSTSQNLERIEPRFEITPSGVQWFDLNVAYTTASGEKFSPADIQRLILSGNGHTRLRNGKTAIIDTGAVEELQEVLLDCAPQQHSKGYRLNQTQASFIQSSLAQQGWKAQAPADWRARVAQQSGNAKLECSPLGPLDSVLRPYQKHGVAWLHFLRANNFGGILADEMGLGKTLQALAFLRSLRRSADFQSAVSQTSSLPAEGRAASSLPRAAVTQSLGENEDPKLGQGEGQTSTLPSLVVCPTSLVWNWLAEATRFTPDLKMLALHGPNRHELFPRIAESDLVITSYALIRRDADKYADIEFDTVILDEAQHIKNRQTQNAQAVKAIKSHHRLVLTGTPLENSVLDLWSIFDFLMPGYLGAAQDFRERYEIPITREKSEAAQTRLARRLRPFMLRRLKREVAPELPAKLEQVSYCELTSDQQAVYTELLQASRREINDAVGAQGLARSRMIILNALLRLRQVCCDLRLLKLDNVNPATASAKVDLFSELLEEVIDGGHRVLVFSQFVTMLHLLRDKLKSEDIDFCYLDGSTSNRGEVVQQFQTSNIPVFLISLKAGGVGLNLTAADTVIHFDPWWNPAVEDQATDRAHRIGQARVVTSYKIIARGTVEEKILALQNRKREIIRATLGGEDALTEALTWEEIQELFST